MANNIIGEQALMDLLREHDRHEGAPHFDMWDPVEKDCFIHDVIESRCTNTQDQIRLDAGGDVFDYVERIIFDDVADIVERLKAEHRHNFH